MNERSELIAWIRSELVGPSQPLTKPIVAEFTDRDFMDPVALRNGPLTWRPANAEELQEVLYFDRESPHRKYGAGLLHPALGPATVPAPDQAALQVADTVGVEPATSAGDTEDSQEDAGDGNEGAKSGESGTVDDATEDFEVTSPDIRHPSTIGISFCVKLDAEGEVVLHLPQSRRFHWQNQSAWPFPLNGRYEVCKRRWTAENGQPKDAPIWRRLPGVAPGTKVVIRRNELISGRVIRKDVGMPASSPIGLRFEVFPRQRQGHTDVWLLTVVLRNSTGLPQAAPRESVLYQTFFEVEIAGGALQKYPESQRPFGQLDPDEQSLALLPTSPRFQ